MDEQKKITEESVKKAITEEGNKAEIKEWFEQARDQTFETLPEFIRHVMNDYVHDYGTVCRAIGACTVATAWAFDRMEGARGGITGFQAGFVMWEFIRNWTYTSNKCGLRIIDYDKLLYPQYEDSFDKTIKPEVWEAVQKAAREELEGLSDGCAANSVVMHLKSIAAGKVPFGFTVQEKRE